MNVEKKIFDPHGWVSCPIVLFYVHRFKPFGDLMLHYLICKTHWVCGALDPGHVVPEIGCHPGTVLLPSSIVPITPGLVSVPSSGRASSGSIDGS
jgi:hypothetical protein